MSIKKTNQARGQASGISAKYVGIERTDRVQSHARDAVRETASEHSSSSQELHMKIRHLLGLILAAVSLGFVPAAQAQKVGKTDIKKVDNALEFYVGDQLVTRYLIAKDLPKPIFFPLHAPGGQPLTRSYPMVKDKPGETKDHPHHQSAWFCHGDIIPEGIELKTKLKGIAGVDFWSINKGHGHMVCTKVVETTNLPGHSYAVTQNEWSTPDGQKMMDETRTIHLYDLGPARLIVIETDMHASVCPLIFGDTKEGAMGIRINDSINGSKTGKGKIQNAEGKIGEKDCWGQFSAWCDYSGPLDGKVVGLTIFDDPKNPYPAAWHVRAYGLMAANPFGREKHAQFPAQKGKSDLVRLEKGKHLEFRYGMLLHEGDAVSGQVDMNYQRFVKLRGKQ